VSRRQVLAGGAAALGTGLAGCSALDGGDGGDAPAAIALDGEKACNACQMSIANNPGPNGQIFYRNEAPNGEGNPAWFEALQQCAFDYHFAKKREGWTVDAFYVTDYSAVDYEFRERGDGYVASSHLGADTFVDAEAVTYVVESDVGGSMGPTEFLPFSERSDAEAVRDEHGGRLLAFDDITRELVRGGN
jgi:nitrous oxide reductase accessory protein NosL